MSRHTTKHRHQTVLALDQAYMPMVEMSRRKALKALATGRAQALDLRTWSRMGLQEVAARPIQAVVFDQVRAYPEVKLGSVRGTYSILRRDGHNCQYEGCVRRGTTVDHVVPRCQGGKTTWTNLVACCLICNSRKGGRTPDQAGMKLKGPIRSQRAILLEKLQVLARME
ncbi:MAG TPA: HNH endonuclease [Holophagaceae bacterium]|nr:HNH endonuclease [Holophagaceae bacterium]